MYKREIKLNDFIDRIERIGVNMRKDYMEKRTTNFVTLPIHASDIECVTDCWIYNRLAIIKTSPYYKDWIASHYDLFMDVSYSFHFGETSVIPAYYHDTILERKPLQFYQFTQDNIINNIKALILKKYYVIMYIKTDADEEIYHEALFFGFNDRKKILLATGLKDNKFQTIEYQYDYIKDTLEDVQNNLRGYFEWVMELCTNYQYPATAFKLNKDYDPQNCPFEAYLKLRNELYGECHMKQKLSKFGEYKESGVFYRGISCLYALILVLNREINEKKFPSGYRGVVQATKKINEHQKMILHSIEYLIEKWGSAMNKKSYCYASDYSQCCRETEKWLNMTIKYQYTGDKELLKRIVPEIPNIMDKEQKILEEFLYHNFDETIFLKDFV